MKSLTILLTGLLTAAAVGCQAAQRPNILIITVDDMNADSIGAFGSKLPATTPHIDRLASEGLRFQYAHVQVATCRPSRNVMWSGRYPHNNRVEGFYQVTDPGYPVLADLMKRAGYFTAIRHKVAASTPYSPYVWDRVLDERPDGKTAHIKDAASYGDSTREGIKAAQKAGKPFCLMINISDPHRPAFAEEDKDTDFEGPHQPSRVFTPDEVPIPGFLFDDPAVRKELAFYYSSVRRADDGVREVLEALEESDAADNTLVLFVSDHGMPLPFVKTQLYHHSTRTPLIIRWPGTTRAGTVDDQHMVSAVDFLPTLLDVIGAEHPEGLDGHSFAPLLKGERQAGRDRIFKEYDENIAASRDPMRAVQTQKFLYLYNPWSNGERVIATTASGTRTYRRMKALAKTDPHLSRRLALHDHRVVEELYDTSQDPDCLVNLIHDPSTSVELSELRSSLMSWMQKTGDPLFEIYQDRENAELREAYVRKVEKEALDRKAGRNKPKKNQQK